MSDTSSRTDTVNGTDAASGTHTALLVIDVQRSFEHASYWSERDVPEWRDCLSSLIAASRQRKWRVVYVRHVGSQPPFTLASGHVELMDFLDRRDDEPIFDKHVHNAFSDTGLDVWLRRQGISRLVISGIRTEQCCETTARVAKDMGFTVDFVLDATLSFDMTHPLDGSLVDADTIRSRTALVLAERFARITCVADYA